MTTGPTIAGTLRSPRPIALVVFAAAALLAPGTCFAQALPSTHSANPADPMDLAVLRAGGDQVSGATIRNSCDAVVHPTISYPAPGVAVHIEKDPTGVCSGSNPPSSLTVLLKTGPAWRIGMSTTGSGFHLGPVQSGYPAIVVEYPPTQKDCPMLGWKGKRYEMIKPCPGERGQ